MFGPGGAVAGGAVSLAFLAHLLQFEQQPQRTFRLAHHAERLGAAFRRYLRRGFGKLRETQAILPLFRGGDELCGEIGLGGVGRHEGGDAGDGSVIALGESVRTVGERRRQGDAERADEMIIGVGGKLEGDPRVEPGGRP